MAKPQPKIKPDPELLRQLKAASSEKTPVEAVFRLRSETPAEIAPSPERTEEITKEVLDRVESNTGSAAGRYNIFRNLGSFVVSAEPEFVKDLITQPEIASAIANVQPVDQKAPNKKPSSPSQRSENSKNNSKKTRSVSKVSGRTPVKRAKV